MRKIHQKGPNTQKSQVDTKTQSEVAPARGILDQSKKIKKDKKPI